MLTAVLGKNWASLWSATCCTACKDEGLEEQFAVSLGTSASTGEVVLAPTLLSNPVAVTSSRKGTRATTFLPADLAKAGAQRAEWQAQPPGGDMSCGTTRTPAGFSPDTAWEDEDDEEPESEEGGASPSRSVSARRAPDTPAAAGLRRKRNVVKSWARKLFGRRRPHATRSLVMRFAWKLKRGAPKSTRKAGGRRRSLRRALGVKRRGGREKGEQSEVVLTPSFAKDCEELPDSHELPDAEPPLVEMVLPGTTLSRVEAAVSKGPGSGPLEAFLVKELGVFDVHATSWAKQRGADELPGGTAMAVQRISYRAPLPKDLPSAVARVLKLPESAQSVTVNRLRRCSSGEGLVLTQCSCARGIQFSDRFFVRHTHAFSRDSAGGVRWRQWTHFIWTKPLPWTQSFIRTVIESRGKAEAKSSASALAQLVQEAL